MKHVIISATSDLVTDQRVHRMAITLHEAQYSVTVFGRQKKNSGTLYKQPYRIYRTRLWAEKGFLFYALYNIRLFIFLMFSKKHALVACDLDTLLPNYIISKLFSVPLVYDSHEYFTEVPEMLHRPMVRNFWKSIEKMIFPDLKYVITVNQSIANMYAREYGVPVLAVRNLPLPQDTNDLAEIPEVFKNINQKIILYQGSVNQDRGIEQIIQAMEWVEGAVFALVGSGDLDEKINTNDR